MPQMPSLDDMKRMADKKAEPLLARLKTDPHNSTLLNQIGTLYKATHQFKEAADYYRKALDADPKTSLRARTSPRASSTRATPMAPSAAAAVAPLRSQGRQLPLQSGDDPAAGEERSSGRGHSLAEIAEVKSDLGPRKEDGRPETDCASQGTQGQRIAGRKTTSPQSQ